MIRMEFKLLAIFVFGLILTSGFCSDYRERSRLDNPAQLENRPPGGGRLMREIENAARNARANRKDNVNVKQIGKLVGKGKYVCLCFRGKTKVWAGMCGVSDRNFNYRDCN